MSTLHLHPRGRHAIAAAAIIPTQPSVRAKPRLLAGAIATLIVIVLCLVTFSGSLPVMAEFTQVGGLISSIHTQYGESVRVDLQGDYAYVVDWNGNLEVIDISDPYNPVSVGNVQYAGNEFQDVKVIGDFAYIANDGSGIAKYDVSDPTAPYRVDARRDTASYTVSVDYDAAERLFASHIYAGDPGLVIYDTPFPSAPIGTYPADPSHMWEVDVQGGRAYIAMADDYAPRQVLSIIDITNPTPTLLGSLLLPSVANYGYGFGLKVVGDYAYLTTVDADSTVGSLIIVNVQDPATPYMESRIEVPGGVMGFWKRPMPDFRDNVVYMTGRNGLYGFDVSDPSNPIQTIYYPYPDDFADTGVGDVYIRGNLAFVAIMPPETREASNGAGGGLAIYKLGVPDVYLSTWKAGIVDGLVYGPHDILLWDGEDWTKWFDGAAAGLEPVGLWKHNINAFSLLDPDTPEVVMSFTQNRQRVADLGWVDGYDLVYWDGTGFSRWFEGEDVGLTGKTMEKIDGLQVLNEPPAWSTFAEDNCLAYLLISTQGRGTVPVAMRFNGEDVLGFCATSLGEETTGQWEMVIDGSAEGVSKSNITSISMTADGQTLYLTSKRQFRVDAAFGGHSMVYAFDMTTGTFSGPVFRAMDHLGIHAKVDGLHIEGSFD